MSVREQRRADARIARDIRWSVQGPATITTRSRRDDTADRSGPPPAWVLDRIADAALYRGYESHPTCDTCHTRKSRVGSCFC